MGFSPEVAERYESGGQTPEVRWLRDPGWHEVEITGYRHAAVGGLGSTHPLTFVRSKAPG